MPRKKVIAPVPPPDNFVPGPTPEEQGIIKNLQEQIAKLQAMLPTPVTPIATIVTPKVVVQTYALTNTPRQLLLKQLTEYRIETQALYSSLGEEERRQRASVETNMLSTLAQMPADKVTLIPTIDKTNFPDRTQELHNLADQGGWYALKKLYMESKCNHYAFLGDPAATLITKAVRSGDLELIKEMVADGGSLDIPCSDPVSPISGRQWVLARGRKQDDKGQPQSMSPLAGESPGRTRMANNVALFDAICGPRKFL